MYCSQIQTHALLEARWKAGSASWQYWLPSVVCKANSMGSILNFFFFLKQPEVRCHPSGIIFTSMSVELGNNCHHSLNAITATANVVKILYLRKGNTLILVFLFKVLFKDELLRIKTCTTRGKKYCSGCAKAAKWTPSVHHSWFWFRYFTHILRMNLCSQIMLSSHQSKTLQNPQLSRSCPGKSHTWRMKREHRQSTYRCPGRLMLLRSSCLGQAHKNSREEQCILRNAPMRSSTVPS